MRSHSDLRSAMRLKLLVMITLVVSTATTAALFAQLLSSIGAQAQTGPRNSPEYIASGDLILRELHVWCSSDLEAHRRSAFRNSRLLRHEGAAE